MVSRHGVQEPQRGWEDRGWEVIVLVMISKAGSRKVPQRRAGERIRERGPRCSLLKRERREGLAWEAEKEARGPGVLCVTK